MSTDEESLLEDPDAMFTALWVTVGVLLLWVARRTYGALLAGGWAGTIMVTQLFVTGLAVIVLATIEGFDLRRYQTPVAAWVIWSLLAVGAYNFIIMDPGYFASDVALFESWAAHLLSLGRNPMGENMLVARQAWNISEQSANITATTSGGVVSSYSYPGGTLWISTLEQSLLPWDRLGFASLLTSIGFLSWLVIRVDEGLVPLAIIAFLAPVLRPVSASMGMITPLWLFPLAVGLAAWYEGRLDVAAVGLGAAVASKQLAWPIAGLVLIHVLRTHGRDAAARLATVAGAVGVVLVGYLIVWDPTMWAISAFFPFLPIGDPLVAQGVGLTSLTVGGVATVPRTLHRGLVLGVAGALVAATWRYPDRMKWVIPFASVITLMFHYRTLPSYYSSAVPLAIVALDARLRGLDDRPRPTLFLDQLLIPPIVRAIRRLSPYRMDLPDQGDRP